MDQYSVGLAIEGIRQLERQINWFEDEIERVYPWKSCPRCAADNPEDATTHVDHFFDRARAAF